MVRCPADQLAVGNDNVELEPPMRQATIFIALASIIGSCQSILSAEFSQAHSSSDPDWLGDMNTGCFNPGRGSNFSKRLIGIDWEETQMSASKERRIQAEIMGQAYQVIAALADAANLSSDASVQRGLNYFSANEYRENFLPFSIKPANTEEEKKLHPQGRLSGDGL